MLYNGADKPACERFSGVDVTACPDAPTSWPVSVTVSRRQGEALKAAVVTAAANGAPLSITLDVPEVAAQKEIGLAAYSGTSMVSMTACYVCCRATSVTRQQCLLVRQISMQCAVTSC